MSARRRSFFGWGYEDEAVPAAELGWFERAWSQLFCVDAFEPAPMPRQSEITLRTPRVLPPPALRGASPADLLKCFRETSRYFHHYLRAECTDHARVPGSLRFAHQAGESPP